MNFIGSHNLSDFIKTAIFNTFKDVDTFYSDPRDLIHAEYLFTVNTAKALSVSGFEGGEPYRIIMEKNTDELIKDCFPQYKIEKNGGGLFGKSTIVKTKIKNYSKVRKGRVDVVVYKSNEDIYTYQNYFLPICLIELKAFNPSFKGVRTDLERNIAILNLEANTGQNSVSFTAFSALEWNQRISIENDERHKLRVEKKYESIIKSIPDINVNFKVDIKVFTIKKSHGDITSDVEFNKDGVPYEIFEIDTSTKHYFVGVIIILEKNQSII